MGGPLHIPFSEIAAYCHLYEIVDYRKKLDFADFVKMLDVLWIEDYYAKESKRKTAEERNNKKK